MFETHDGRLHIAKLHWFVEAIEQGHFPVRWTETANHQYGYPLFIFYYPLLYYLGSLFVFLGSSLTDAAKIILAGSYVLSGLVMYRLLREWVSALSAWVGTILYLFAPYRFVSLFVTGRWAESLSFAVIPLVFLTISKIYWSNKGNLSNKANWLKLGAISFALLILSHNVQAMLFTPLILLFMLILIISLRSDLRRSFTVCCLLFTVLALFLSASFWLPALYELKWTYQGQKPVYDFRENFPSLRSYLYYPWGYGFSLTGTKDGTSPMVGVAQIGGVGFGVLGLLGLLGRLDPPSREVARRQSVERQSAPARQSKTVVLGVLLLISGATFFFMNRVSLPLWEKIPMLPSIQFPSRLTGVLVFFIPVIVALSLDLVHSRWMKTAAAVSLVALALYSNRNHLRPAVPDRFADRDVLSIYQNIFGTGETSGENAPVWSQALPPPYENRKIELLRKLREFRCPDVSFSDISVEPRRYRFTVNNRTDHSYDVQINTVYYPGWRISVDGEPVYLREPLTPKVNPFGLIRVSILPGEHVVRALFTETPLRKTADAISLGSLAGLLLWPQRRKKDDAGSDRQEV